MDLDDECSNLFTLLAGIGSFALTVVVCFFHAIGRCIHNCTRARKMAKAQELVDQGLGVTCPKGHPLLRYRDKKPCDRCQQKVQYVWGCRLDKYGICHDCHQDLLADLPSVGVKIKVDANLLLAGLQAKPARSSPPGDSGDVEMGDTESPQGSGMTATGSNNGAQKADMMATGSNRAAMTATGSNRLRLASPPPGVPSQDEKRIAEDGEAYTRKEFDEYFGEEANMMWKGSAPVDRSAVAVKIVQEGASSIKQSTSEESLKQTSSAREGKMAPASSYSAINRQDVTARRRPQAGSMRDRSSRSPRPNDMRGDDSAQPSTSIRGMDRMSRPVKQEQDASPRMSDRPSASQGRTSSRSPRPSGRQQQRRRDDEEPATMSRVESDFSVVSGVDDDEEDEPTRSRKENRWRASQKYKRGEEIVIAFKATQKIATKDREHLDEWFWEQVKVKAMEDGLIERDAENLIANTLEIFDEEGGEYGSLDALSEAAAGMSPDAFPVELVFTANRPRPRGRNRRDKNDEFAKDMGKAISSNAGSGRNWRR